MAGSLAHSGDLGSALAGHSSKKWARLDRTRKVYACYMRSDQDSVWFNAVVQKVTPTLVQVFYPEDNETKRHNLLVSGITKKSPKPLRDYMEKGVRWKIKK